MEVDCDHLGVLRLSCAGSDNFIPGIDQYCFQGGN